MNEQTAADHSDLVHQQQLFTFNIGKLIEHAYTTGYALTFGEAWRSWHEAQRLAAVGSGSSRSLHVDRLAVDFNLFIGRQWLRDSRDHRQLGIYWKSLHPENAWGGDFKDKAGKAKPDGNHYSMIWQGRK